MQKLLVFLAFSVVFVFGYACFIKWLWSMMQDGAAFDTMSGGKWTKYKDRIYGGKPYQQMLVKILGDCEQCGSFWWSFPWVVAYFIFCYTSGIWCLCLAASIIWGLVFISICSFIGLKTITHKRDGV